MPVPDYYQRHKLINTHAHTQAHTQMETHQIVPAAHLRVTERERGKDEVRLVGQSKEMQMQMWATL